MTEGIELPNDREWSIESQMALQRYSRTLRCLSHPCRDTVIGSDEVTNLVIDLNTLSTEEVLQKHFCF